MDNGQQGLDKTTEVMDTQRDFGLAALDGGGMDQTWTRRVVKIEILNYPGTGYDRTIH